MKTCSADGCSNPVFSNLYCKYHQYLRRRRGGDQYISKPRTSIPKESAKRKEEKKYYTQHCAEMTQEIKDTNGGIIRCFFSGKEIQGKPVYHHLKGRSGKFYIDKEFLVPALNGYHLNYHFKPVAWLMQQDWYVNMFLPNLRAKSEELYDKELKKQDKGILFEE
jgi:hypothetical protein